MSIQEVYDAQVDTISTHYDAIHTFIIDSETLPGGTCYYYHDSTEVYADMIPKRANLYYHARGAERVAEIGFNAGHSTVLFALANPAAQITVFDLFNQPYAQSCLDYVCSALPNQIESIVGTTMDTLGPYADEHAGTFDLVHVDGGYMIDNFLNDFHGALKMVKIGGLVIVENDVITYISNHLNDSISEGLVEEVTDRLRINTYEHRILRRIQ
jgi:predicted O-methyltransferase YrrM